MLEPTNPDAEETRNRLAAIVASSHDAIISKTLDGVIVTWNAAAERIFGYSAQEVIGKPITILIPPELLDQEPQILARLRRGDSIDHFETVRVRKDGTRVEISLSVSPVRNALGQIVGAAKIVRDITHQKHIEETLRQTNERFRTMADSAPVLIWMADQNKNCTWFNRGWLDFTGRTLEQEVGFGWLQNVHPDDVAACMQAYAEAFEKRLPFTLEFRLTRRDGEARWMVDRAVPLHEGPNGAFSGYIGTCIDISDSRKLATEREGALQAERAAREEAERLSRMKDEFLATLSHELRTPLNAILGWSTLLRRIAPGSDDHTKGLETIERNARAQAQIISDLLDMSRIISGKVHLDVQPVDLQEVIAAAIDAVKPSIEAKNLRLRTTLAQIGSLRGDPGRLQQVMWNLLSNAVKFTPAGGRIDIVLERVNSHVEISVEDSGIGIKTEFLAFVFDRFRQADASTSRRYGGLGLGLSIVKHLVELHGGSVRVKSGGEGAGSTFIIALPISAMRAEDTGDHERPSFADIDLSTMQLPSLAGAYALIVDDEPDAHTLVAHLIEERGGKAIVATTGTQALQYLMTDRQINILISDIGMPDFDGYQLIQRVRALQNAKVRRIAAIALTAYARADDRQRALLAGYQMHLAKPVDPRELIAGIASLLNLQSPSIAALQPADLPEER